MSLQHNNLSGTIPEKYLKKLQLKALQLEGNEKLHGKIDRDSLLCQMRKRCKSCSFVQCFLFRTFSYLIRFFFEDEGPPPEDSETYTGPQLLRIFTATCVPDHSSFGGSNHMLECACWKVRVCVVVLSYVTVCSIF